MTDATQARRRAGWAAALVIAALYGGVALTVDYPKAAGDIFSDEATYLLMGHSLASDLDLEYRREDLERAFAEWPKGPQGIFLKEGVDVRGFTLKTSFPFFDLPGVPDRRAGERLYYGKSFIYPLVAAPFVAIFGTNGFLVVNAVLLVAAFLAAYFFVSARSSIPVSLVLASAFIFASVIPVYFVWTQPELFNFSLGVLAYFLWLYKYVAPTAASPRSAWLRSRWTDAAAGALVGVLTFSKVSNLLLVLPIAGWLLWQRQWRRAMEATAACVLLAGFFFSLNVAITGEWNYQGGTRATCYDTFPFQKPPGALRAGLDVESCALRGRDDTLEEELFDPEVFWQNLFANAGYFFVGRYGGLIPYFFPGAFAIGALLLARGRRERWQWFVLAGLAIEAALFIVSLPYTWLGGGGSVGNRYFTGVYGLAVFLLPPMQSMRVAAVPWIVGSLFMAKLVLNPFQTSLKPFEPAKSGPLRWFPVELTNTNDLPINNEGHRVKLWYGTEHPPGFQIYHLDDNAYLREADGVSFSIRGGARAEMLIKADSFVDEAAKDVRPPRILQVKVVSGHAPTEVEIRIGSRRQSKQLGVNESWIAQLPLPEPFLYDLTQGAPRPMPALVWLLSISSSHGYLPQMIDPTSQDRRFLGVRVTPNLIR